MSSPEEVVARARVNKLPEAEPAGAPPETPVRTESSTRTYNVYLPTKKQVLAVVEQMKRYTRSDDDKKRVERAEKYAAWVRAGKP